MKKFDNETRQVAFNMLAKDYFQGSIATLSYDETVKTLSYLKTAIVTPEGGTYLVSILHIDGPKLDMDAFRAEVEKVEAEGVEEGNKKA